MIPLQKRTTALGQTDAETTSKKRKGNEVKDQNCLPHYGAGLVLVIFMIAITAGGIALSELGRFPKIGFGALKLPAAVLGGLLIMIGAAMTAAALLASKRHRSAESGELLTTGVYAWIKNPIYTGIMLICTGTIFIYGNLALIVFPLIMYFAAYACGGSAVIAVYKKYFEGGVKRHDDQ